MPYAQLRDRIGAEFTLEPVIGHPSDVGKSFVLQGYPTRVSFVSSMTESFCSTCNRLRLTADGNIKACLFHPAEKSLRDIMRAGGSDADLEAAISLALDEKPAAHAPMDELLKMGNRAMIAIGG